jgi:hypothetical protein
MNTSIDITSRILAAKQITVSWICDNVHGYLYEIVNGSIVANAEALSLRFELREKDGEDDAFEVIVTRSGELHVLRVDYFGMEDRDYPLKVYVSPDEIILYFEDVHNRAHFHLS